MKRRISKSARLRIAEELEGTSLNLSDDAVWQAIEHMIGAVEQKKKAGRRLDIPTRRKMLRRLESLQRAIKGLHKDDVAVLASGRAWSRYDKQTKGLPLEKRAIPIDKSPDQEQAELRAMLDEIAAASQMATSFLKRKRGMRGRNEVVDLIRAFVWHAAMPYAIAGGKNICDSKNSLYLRWLEVLNNELRLVPLSTRPLYEGNYKKHSAADGVRHAVRAMFGATKEQRAKTFACASALSHLHRLS